MVFFDIDIQGHNAGRMIMEVWCVCVCLSVSLSLSLSLSLSFLSLLESFSLLKEDEKVLIKTVGYSWRGGYAC